MKRSLFAAIGLLAGIPACSGAATEPYEYGIVELPAQEADIDNPRARFDALRDLAQERAAGEAGDTEGAFRSATYFGADADSLLAYAITPEKGVFYYLPPGPYPVSGNSMRAMPDPVPVCRFVVDWKKLPDAPIVASSREIEFLTKDCEPFDRSAYPPPEPIATDSDITLIPADPVDGHPVTLVSADSSSRFDNGRALGMAFQAGNMVLAQAVPLTVNGRELVAGISTSGEVSLLIESSFLNSRQRCILSGIEWSDLGIVLLRTDAERSCSSAAKSGN